MRSGSGLFTTDKKPGQGSQAAHPPGKYPRSAATRNTFKHDQKSVQAKITPFAAAC
jgi:hypothetical protein